MIAATAGTYRTTPSSTALGRVAPALGLLAFVILVRGIGFLPGVINPDESIFMLAAREVLHGNLPYVTLFDNKPVGSTLMLAGAFTLFGQSLLVARLLGVVCVWGAALGVAALVERGGGSRVQAWAAAALLVAFTGMIGGLASLTEILLMPFTVLAVLLLREQLAAPRLATMTAAGLACGGAVLVKIVPIVPGGVVAATVLLLLLARRRVALPQAVILGGAFLLTAMAPMLIAAMVYAAQGQLDAFLYANFGFARAYAAIHPGVATVVQRLATTVDALWPLLLLAGSALALVLWRRRASDLALLSAAWLVGEFLAASASLQFFPHYFLTAVAPLAILSSCALAAFVTWLGTPHRSVALAVAAVTVGLIGVEHTEIERLREVAAGTDASGRIAQAIGAAQGGVTPSLFVADYKLANLYSLTGAPLPPTRYAVPAHLLSRQSGMVRADPAAEIARVLASRPDYLVFNRDDVLPNWARSQFAGAVTTGYTTFYRDGPIVVFARRRPSNAATT